MGWPTSKQTKEQMLGDLQESLIEDSWEINSVSLLKQMNNLTWDPLKRNWGMAGEKDPITGLFHDDGIDSLAIAHEMLLIHRKNLITEGLKLQREPWTL
jgi:hypothetical protein